MVSCVMLYNYSSCPSQLVHAFVIPLSLSSVYMHGFPFYLQMMFGFSHVFFFASIHHQMVFASIFSAMMNLSWCDACFFANRLFYSKKKLHSYERFVSRMILDYMITMFLNVFKHLSMLLITKYVFSEERNNQWSTWILS